MGIQQKSLFQSFFLKLYIIIITGPKSLKDLNKGLNKYGDLSFHSKLVLWNFFKNPICCEMTDDHQILPCNFSLTIFCHFGNLAKLIAIDLAVTDDSIAPPLDNFYGLFLYTFQSKEFQTTHPINECKLQTISFLVILPAW